MRYFIRHDKNARVDGPLTLEELKERVVKGLVPPDCLGSTDAGSTPEQLQKYRACDWFHLAEIPGFRGLVAAPPAAVPKPPSALFLLAMMVAIAGEELNRLASAKHNWLDWVVLVSAGISMSAA